MDQNQEKHRYQRRDLVSPTGSNHFQFNKFGFEPNPTGLGPDDEWKILATGLRSKVVELGTIYKLDFVVKIVAIEIYINSLS